MKLFISYARVDKPYCIHIVENLDVHETWLDQRLYAGQHWWKEILRRLDWCEGLVYLLSPDSIASEYCRKEFELAKNLGRHIFPVIIREDTVVPDWLMEYQYADISKGTNSEGLRVLLNSITLAEREQRENNNHNQKMATVATVAPEEMKQPTVNPTTVIRVAAQAMEKGDYDQVVFLLKQAKATNSISHYINVDVMLQEAEAALNRKAYLLQADRGYRQIAEMFNHKSTFKLGWEAFQEFQKDFPDYDPDNLALRPPPNSPTSTSTGLSPVVTKELVSAGGGGSSNGNGKNGSHVEIPIIIEESFRLSLPLLEWCNIPSGKVDMLDAAEDGKRSKRSSEVDVFQISKYPVTNAQYQAFVNDASGYGNVSWWQYSQDAHQWRMKNPQPRESKFKGDERPREMVTWYEAMAFCEWLSYSLSAKICLPSAIQWQRAFQGDDNRVYPWGSTFEQDRCNTVESQIKMTTLVTRYPNGVSPYGVYDMAGNVWEWCRDSRATNNPSPDEKQKRIVRGGSYIGPHQRAHVAFQFELEPESYHASIGFRIVLNR
jgi:formylglycine-generating enzyme required for sulfatase activity